MSEARAETELDPGQIASHLRRNPGFLSEYPDLALSLELPREQGRTASLASYQIEVLRDKNRQLNRRLRELIEIAHDNEQLMVRVHGFTLALMRAPDLVATVRAVAAALTEDFHVDLVRLALFRGDPELPVAPWLLVEPRGAAALPAFAEFLSKGEPLCGRLRADKLEFLFAEQAARVHSAALLALSGAGLLAIGSEEANRFHPGMGTLFLELIGTAVATALERFPPVAP